MAWINAFDIGACALTVHEDGSATAMTAGEMTDANVTLVADTAGLVTLTAPYFSSSGGSFEVRVTPDYETASAPVRLTEIVDGLTIGPHYPSWSPNPQTHAVPWDPPPGPSIPAVDTEQTFIPDQPWTFAGLAIYREGV